MSAAIVVVLIISILTFLAVIGLYDKFRPEDKTFVGSVLDEPNDDDLFHPATRSESYTMSLPKRGDSARSQKRGADGRFIKQN